MRDQRESIKKIFFDMNLLYPASCNCHEMIFRKSPQIRSVEMRKELATVIVVIGEIEGREDSDLK